MYGYCTLWNSEGKAQSRYSINYTTRRYNPYTLENHSTADLYYDATNQALGSVFPTTLCFSMQLGCIVIHPRVYELSRVHGFCTSSFSFEVWLHHSTSIYVHGFSCVHTEHLMSLDINYIINHNDIVCD